MTGRELHGIRVVVLRVGEGPDAIATKLSDRGAVATTVCVATVADRLDDALRADVGRLERFAWVAVTSANAARRLDVLAASWPPAVRIGSVGPATTRSLVGAGLHADLEATGGTAADLARAIDTGPVLFVASSAARRDLVEVLEERGIEVVVVTAYDVTHRALDDDERGLIASADVVVATSPSTVDALVAARGPAAPSLVAIGPTTASHARALGLEVAAVASTRDGTAVADAVSSVVP